MVKASKKNPLTHTELAKKRKHLNELGETVQGKNLEIIKRQNRNYAKQRAGNFGKRRRSSEGDESESDRIVKKCYEEWLKEEAANDNNDDDSGQTSLIQNDDDKDEVAEDRYKTWKKEEFDSYNSINRRDLLSKIEMFEKMIKATRKVECCSTSSQTTADNRIMWTSPTYVARYIHKCILRHEWAELAHLLQLLTKHSRLYESYTREMAFLTALMSIDKCERDMMANLKLCFVTEKIQERKEFDVWYVEKSPDDTDSN